MKQSIFLAKHNNSFNKPSLFDNGDVPCSAIEKLADLIDAQWVHSMYWPHDKENELLDKIQGSLSDEMKKAHKRLYDLIEAQNILDNIERNQNEENNGNK
jgi:hypothetical protein